MTGPIDNAFDRLVLAIMERTGAPREKAIEVAKQNRPDLADLAAASAAMMERDARVLERTEQAYIAHLAKVYGFKVRNLSQYRPSKVATGIADLILVHRARGIGLFWETKRQVGGVQSEDQIEFESDCRLAGWTYRIGDRYDFARYLLNLGLAEPGAGPCGIERAASRPLSIEIVLADRPE